MTSRETHPESFTLDVAAAVDDFSRALPLRNVLAMVEELHEHGDLAAADLRLYMQCWQGVRLQDVPARRVRLDAWFDEILAERERLLEPEQDPGDGQAA